MSTVLVVAAEGGPTATARRLLTAAAALGLPASVVVSQDNGQAFEVPTEVAERAVQPEQKPGPEPVALTGDGAVREPQPTYGDGTPIPTPDSLPEPGVGGATASDTPTVDPGDEPPPTPEPKRRRRTTEE